MTSRTISKTNSKLTSESAAWDRYFRPGATRREREICETYLLAKFDRFGRKQVSEMEASAAALGVDMEDFQAAARMGLLKAIRKYDRSRGFTFTTLAYHEVRGAIKNECRTHRFVKEHGAWGNMKIAEVQKAYQETLGRDADEHELAETLGWGLGRVRSRLGLRRAAVVHTESQLASQTLAGDILRVDIGERSRLIYDREDVSLISRPADVQVGVDWPRAFDPECLCLMTPRELEAFEIFYSSDESDELTMDDAGHAMGISRQRVHQILTNALAKVKAHHGVKKCTASTLD